MAKTNKVKVESIKKDIERIKELQSIEMDNRLKLSLFKPGELKTILRLALWSLQSQLFSESPDKKEGEDW